jgi:hypothetical protein
MMNSLAVFLPPLTDDPFVMIIVARFL